MGLIARPPKEGGFLTYTEKVLAGFELILDTEADADLETIYNEFNGNITNANISDTAAIAASKLDLAAAVSTAELANGSVTTPKLAQNATTPAFATANVPSSLTILDTEQTVVTLPSITTRGGRVLLTGTIALLYLQARNVAVTATLRIKANAALVSQFDYPLVTADLADISFTTLPLPTPSLLFTPAAGTYIFTVTAQLSAAASGSIVTPPSASGTYSVVEFA